ncbi:MAG: D-alanyl-D-alanine carboxypeptidase family protein [Halorhodospira sp.]
MTSPIKEEVAVGAAHRRLGIPRDYSERTGLSRQTYPAALVPVLVDPRRGAFSMSRDAADAWLDLQAEARRVGHELIVVSTFRSIEEQEHLIRARLDGGEDIREILETSTAPGYSEHHSGAAIDVTVPEVGSLDEEFAETEAFAWLEDNAERFGFHLSYPEDNDHGLDFEPWHWRYKGKGGHS